MAESASNPLNPILKGFTPITNPSKLLIRYGFWKKNCADKYKGLSEEALHDKIMKMSDEDAEKDADEHDIELVNGQMFRSGYPNCKKNYHLIYETFNKPVEAFYYWALNHFRDLGFPLVDKITDTFAASEQSALYGASAQRLGLAQDRVTQYIASIGKMVRELFQMTREIRIIKERLDLYKGSMSKDPKVADHFEVALKGLYVDMVEGGAKNATSVFGMASQLQFTVLPDLFFSTHVKDANDITAVVDKLEFNDRVKSVLKRKLTGYYTWKGATYNELQDREQHMLKYLRQHYDVIQMYMAWVKPYLKNVKRLSANQKELDSSDIVAAFEGSIVEIEVLAKKLPKGSKKTYECILFNLRYRTSPSMSFSREGRHQGPLHMGRIDMTWRSYAWDEETINRYKAMRDAETFAMLGEIDQSIREAMAGVGDALTKYLEEARMSTSERAAKSESGKSAQQKKKEHDAKQPGILDELGLKELMKSLQGVFAEEKKPKKDSAKPPTSMMWLHYRNMKKANGMIQW